MLDEVRALDLVDRVIGELFPWEFQEILNVGGRLCLDDINALETFGNAVTTGE